MGNPLFGVDIAGIIADALGDGLLDVTSPATTRATRDANNLTGGKPKDARDGHGIKGFWEDFTGQPPPGVEIELGDRKAVLIGDTIPAGGHSAPERRDHHRGGDALRGPAGQPRPGRSGLHLPVPGPWAPSRSSVVEVLLILKADETVEDPAERLNRLVDQQETRIANIFRTAIAALKDEIDLDALATELEQGRVNEALDRLQHAADSLGPRRTWRS
jgi:hypothetical protein